MIRERPGKPLWNENRALAGSGHLEHSEGLQREAVEKGRRKINGGAKNRSSKDSTGLLVV